MRAGEREREEKGSDGEREAVGKRTDDRRRRRAGGVAARRLTAQAPVDDGEAAPTAEQPRMRAASRNRNRLADRPWRGREQQPNTAVGQVAATIDDDAGEQCDARH
ncbi:hypothetical protein Syun_028204 [Stephania yunnanensis]|uniref:Uncharacterized protein n=1 Tax=Stephania yunnanensis TaxID=152371 RepID=A0AAP0EP89_9MAGN